MKQHHGGFVRGVVVGLTAGLLLGGTAAAWANFGKKGWERFGPLFQEGYIAGFNDCVRLAEGLDPDGYVATNFTIPPKAKPTMWRVKVNELYAKEEHAERPMSQIMVIAGKELAKSTGYVEVRGHDPRLGNLRKALDARHKAIRETSEGAKAADSSDAASSPVAVETTPPTPQETMEASPPPGPAAPKSDAPR